MKVLLLKALTLIFSVSTAIASPQFEAEAVQSIPEKILAKAKTQKGVDYVFGGGNCKGPTSGGFDCSGLLTYAVCQVTGRDLIEEGIRVTREMYCASANKLKPFKKVPFSQRKAGDAVFFGGGGCECDTAAEKKKIHHLGIMLDSGWRMWNALKTGTKVREDNFKGWDGNNSPCPSVIRLA